MTKICFVKCYPLQKSPRHWLSFPNPHFSVPSWPLFAVNCLPSRQMEQNAVPSIIICNTIMLALASIGLLVKLLMLGHSHYLGIDGGMPPLLITVWYLPLANTFVFQFFAWSAGCAPFTIGLLLLIADSLFRSSHLCCASLLFGVRFIASHMIHWYGADI